MHCVAHRGLCMVHAKLFRREIRSASLARLESAPREPDDVSDKSEIDLINEFADELNAEAEDVLEYQVIT